MEIRYLFLFFSFLISSFSFSAQKPKPAQQRPDGMSKEFGNDMRLAANPDALVVLDRIIEPFDVISKCDEKCKKFADYLEYCSVIIGMCFCCQRNFNERTHTN